MPGHVLVRHMIDDFSNWKAVFDHHQSQANKYGLQSLRVLRDINNKHEITILLEAEDLERAKAFMTSDHLQDLMEKAGVVGKTEVYYLADVTHKK